MRHLRKSTLICCVAAAVAGCDSVPRYQEADFWYYRNQPERVEEAYAEALEDKGRDALVGVEKLLSCSIARGDWERADALAERASTMVNIYVAGESGEQDALGLLGREKDKPFKGEPHEQVMVDFYLGLLRYQRRDFEGALAAFRSAINKDRGSFLVPVDVARAESGADNVDRYLYQDDWAILRFLAAKCYQLLGEPEEAARQLKVAKEIAPRISALLEEGMDPRNNVLMVIEGGRAPFKRRTGPQGAILDYGKAAVPEVKSLHVGSAGLSFSLIDDLFFQATTLGGRAVDQLNKDKAAKQQALHSAGFAAATAGYVLAAAGSFSSSKKTRGNLQAAGLIAVGVGIIAMLFAEHAIDPGADLRAWTLLPGALFLGVGRVPASSGATIKVISTGPRGNESQTWTQVPVTEENNLYWIRLLPGRRGGVWNAPQVQP